MIHRVSGLDDPRVADYARVGDPSWLRARNLFVAEGRLVVRRLLEDRRFTALSLLVTPAALSSLDGLVDDGEDATPVFVCDQSQMNALTGFHFHRGCLALARRPAPLELAALIGVRPLKGSDPNLVSGLRSAIWEIGLPGTGARVLVGLEAVGNPDNVGGIFRSALALGADGVVVDSRCADPLYRKAIRTSMGAALRVPFAEVDEWGTAAAALRGAGFFIVALTPAADAVDIDDARSVVAGRRVVLLLGSEGDGLSASALASADLRVRIPVDPRSDSLNVAVAAGIALHAFR